MKTPSTLINACLVLSVATIASQPGMSTGVEARPMHAGMDYERYLLDKEDIVNELKSWMAKWKEAAKKNHWIPITQAMTAEDVEEDHRQRFFLAKQLVNRLKKENPEAEFSTDSPFSLMTTDEFSQYIKNSYIAGGGSRALREEVEQAPEAVEASSDLSSFVSNLFKRSSSSDSATIRAPTGETYSINIGDLIRGFDWSSLFRPTAAPTTRPPAPTTKAPVTSAPVPTTGAPVPTTGAPVPTPSAPVPSTSAPVPTTSAPVPTTSAPVPTTTRPSTTRPAPVPTTTRPIQTPRPNGPVGPVAPIFPDAPLPSPTGEVAGDSSYIVDWSVGKCMPPVQNQGQCGSCWSFAAVSAVESSQCIATGGNTLTKYSEQTLASCDTARNAGCNGGVPQYAMQYIQKEGLCTLADDPYTSSNGRLSACNKSCTKLSTGMKGAQALAKTESALIGALNQHPVVIAVQAGNDAWKQYKSGVLSACPNAAAQVDHAVVAVAYDATTFKVRNSWGPRWGEAGYIRLARSAAGTCKMYQQMVHATF